MNRKAYFIATGCLLFGVVLGGWGAMAFWRKQMGDMCVRVKEVELVESGERVFAAYKHETPQVAIYALTEHLDTLKKAEQTLGGNAIIFAKHNPNFDMMLAHARLAKVYAAAGQVDLGARQLAEALRRASQDRKLQSITNEIALGDIVDRIDKGATK